MTSDPAQHPPTDAGPNATDRSLRRFAALAIPALLVGCTATGTSSGSDGQSGADSPEVIAASLTRIELTDLLANGPTLDGSGNNVSDPTVGQAGLIYPRETAANYADGIGEVSHLIDEGDFSGQECIGGVFNHLGGLPVTPYKGYRNQIESPVNLFNQFSGSLGFGTNHCSVGMEEVLHSPAFSEKLGVGDNIHIGIRTTGSDMLFKSSISNLTMTCLRCNDFVKIPNRDS